MNNIIRCESINKTYQGLDVAVLNGIDLTVNSGEQIAIVGASGSGKSTLLHLLGGLDTPTSGLIELLGNNINQMTEARKGQIRNDSLGFVYQFHHLLPEFTAIENVAMPLLIRRMEREQALVKAKAMLDKVNMSHRVAHMPNELSGGERQRVALARALVTEPAAILADEPTGNLDRVTANQVFDLLVEINTILNTSLIVVTHDMALANRMQKQYQLVDGLLNPFS